jgi:hypothetical protein
MRSSKDTAQAAMKTNNLAIELKQIERWWLRRGALMAIAGSTVAIGLGIAYDGMMDKALFAAAVWSGLCLHGELTKGTQLGRYRKVASGLSGETFIYKVLEGVDSRFTVRNQVLLPNSRSRTGHTEADFILIGRKALYLVETKNNAGRIEVSEEAPEWPLTVTLPDGTKRASSMRNPVRQVKVQAKVLRQRLAEKGLHPIIQPTVAFSNPDAQLVEHESPSVPVFTRPMDDLVARIRAYEEKLADWPDLDMAQMNAVLDDLHAEALRVAKPFRK